MNVILEKSAESKPEMSKKTKNQDRRQSMQEASSKAIPKVEAVPMKGSITRRTAKSKR